MPRIRMGYPRIATAAVAMALAVLMSSGVLADKSKEKQHARTMTAKDLPAAVTAAFAASYPKAVVLKVSKETKDSTTYFEVESKDGKTRRNLLYSADGKAVEIEEAISAGLLPDAAKTTIQKDYPNGKIETAEKVTRGTTVEYEVTIEIKGASNELVFDADGKVIKSATAGEQEGAEKEDEDD